MYFAVLQVHLNFSCVYFLRFLIFTSHCIVNIFCSFLDGAISLYLCPCSLPTSGLATSVNRSLTCMWHPRFSSSGWWDHLDQGLVLFWWQRFGPQHCTGLLLSSVPPIQGSATSTWAMWRMVPAFPLLFITFFSLEWERTTKGNSDPLQGFWRRGCRCSC